MKKQGSDFLSILKKIDLNYLDIMGGQAYAVLCYLLYIKRGELRSSVTAQEIMSRLNLDKKTFQHAISVLKTIELARFSTENGETSFQIRLSDKVTLNEKKVMVDLLLNKDLINQERRDLLFDYLEKKHIDNGKKVNIISTDDSIKDIDITKIRVKSAPREHTGVGLVRFYYKHLNEKFKIESRSPNEQREAHMINLAMKKFGDDFEMTKKILLRIIEKYSRTGEFDKASNLFRYHSERNAAYFDVFGIKQDKFVKEFKPDTEYSVANCKNIYEYFKDKDESFEFIFENRIRPTLTEMSQEEIAMIKQTLLQV